jgi:RNA polymerase sigma-70 factor (ECF subfamily)
LQQDSEIIASVMAGDRQAYALLVRRYERAVQMVALHIVRDAHAAEDAVQDTFLAAFSGLGTLRDPSKFGPWVLQIARRQALRLAKRRSRMPQAAGEAERIETNNGHLDQELLEVLAALSRLPETQRIVVTLHYLQGQDVAEIAAASGCPVGTVTKQLTRARQRLRTLLKEADQ